MYVCMYVWMYVCMYVCVYCIEAFGATHMDEFFDISTKHGSVLKIIDILLLGSPNFDP